MAGDRSIRCTACQYSFPNYINNISKIFSKDGGAIARVFDYALHPGIESQKHSIRVQVHILEERGAGIVPYL